MKSNPDQMEQVKHKSEFRDLSQTPAHTLAAGSEYGLSSGLWLLTAATDQCLAGKRAGTLGQLQLRK